MTSTNVSTQNILLHFICFLAPLLFPLQLPFSFHLLYLLPLQLLFFVIPRWFLLLPPTASTCRYSHEYQLFKNKSVSKQMSFYRFPSYTSNALIHNHKSVVVLLLTRTTITTNKFIICENMVCCWILILNLPFHSLPFSALESCPITPTLHPSNFYSPSTHFFTPSYSPSISSLFAFSPCWWCCFSFTQSLFHPLNPLLQILHFFLIHIISTEIIQQLI